MSDLPLVFELKSNALDDGPGIRTVIFFKGCPLRCVWCHNPEGQSRVAELLFDAARCVACGACALHCRHAAQSRGQPGQIEREQCQRCFNCVAACPSRALQQVGQIANPTELVERVMRDAPFWKASGGGVTFSGGEPTLFPEFVQALGQALRARGVHVLLETCGVFEPEQFFARVYPHVDQIFFDLKLADPVRHRALCGADNRLVFENLSRLVARARNGGVPILPRIALVPGLTDTAENLTGLAQILRTLQVTRVALLAYHSTWTTKLAGLGRPLPLALAQLQSAHALNQAARSAFTGFELV